MEVIDQQRAPALNRDAQSSNRGGSRLEASFCWRARLSREMSSMTRADGERGYWEINTSTFVSGTGAWLRKMVNTRGSSFRARIGASEPWSASVSR